ncbi:unnamed protein product [Rangifer tarandus platyrhynchus]|uniref:Uncharacterized protein n=1 Tax=Rangifer tarandus platyrhynchus TaxID=3082113 RepID=A0ABN8ZA33_RANTA|nr:unnamed protein product [Rangifer tarandus platyrhynchus]CAI9688760.1 unnamed protein product [Rangifer tarandus platyrhynchus]
MGGASAVGPRQRLPMVGLAWAKSWQQCPSQCRAGLDGAQEPWSPARSQRAFSDWGRLPISTEASALRSLAGCVAEAQEWLIRNVSVDLGESPAHSCGLAVPRTPIALHSGYHQGQLLIFVALVTGVRDAPPPPP